MADWYDEEPRLPPLADWIPDPHERQWFRRITDGQRGFLIRLVNEKGKLVDHIQLDRPSEVIRIKLSPGEWQPDSESRPFSLAQVAMVAFEADRALCRIIGRHDRAEQEWLGLKDEQRRAWMLQGPKDDPLRARMYYSIMSVLRELAG